MDGFIGILGVVALLLVVGGGFGLLLPGRISWLWLLSAAGLVFVNDAMLTRVWGLIPDVIPHSNWNWQGKLMALAVTLAVAALPMLGWKRSGLTLTQAPGSWKTALPVTAAYAGLFLVMALIFPNESASKEAIAFQLTMPGLEEEPFYRGVLLVALGQAFSGRLRLLGVDWSLGALLSCALFGLAHAFGFSDGAFSFDPMTMALTSLPSLIGVWLVLKTRSLLLPVLMHNFGNAIMLLV
ncbi:CPBP family intramembrane glutamic endopeptidase, BDIM_20840 family [Brevundimonas goettingensis]|uniref:CPBP family intramembrane metalloprotease n=1 Tax=Brevundimonas goettingensis TaxID=2774190 RepID=A0A975C227_9CAUL|nr:CPBP family intramembrane glutamic endopeptidase [Brevundimonas goettingensis]QTC92075.1 CPBP family intramembrane metalloprotease [Brevundimonas goettingensis]